MKKILLLIMMGVLISMALPSVSNAQTSLLGANGLSTDTVSNSATKTLTAELTGYYATVTIQVDITKISGTLAGTLKPIASNDGVTYYDVSNLSTVSRDTAVTVTDVASQGYLYQMPLGYKYYGVKWTGSGTMSGSFQATLLARKPYQ